MFAGSRSVAQPDSPTGVEDDYPRAEDWLNGHDPGPSLPHGLGLGDEGKSLSLNLGMVLLTSER